MHCQFSSDRKFKSIFYQCFSARMRRDFDSDDEKEAEDLETLMNKMG